MFKSPEHALAVAFTIMESPLGPKIATLRVIECLEDRYGIGRMTVPTGVSPLEWHAQAVMILSFAENKLTRGCVLWDVVVAEFSRGFRGAQAIQAVSAHLAPELSAADRLLTDFLVMRAFRRKPPLSQLAEHFGMAPSTIARREKALHPAINALRSSAIQRLSEPMESAGFVDFSGGQNKPLTNEMRLTTI